MSVTLTKRKLSISSKPTIAEEPKQKELPIDSMVQETIRKVDKIFLDKKFDSYDPPDPSSSILLFLAFLI